MGRMIRLKAIKEIPEQLVNSFMQETKASEEFRLKIRRAEVKIGAFSKGKLVGFAVGVQQQYKDGPTILDVPAIYVKSGHRREGTATKLVYRIVTEARKRGLEGIDIDRPTKNTVQMIEKEMAKWAARRKKTLNGKNVLNNLWFSIRFRRKRR